eukprot:TRINITY_DN1247_c0_g1_i1.p1 TRINITY_DN1247_c0_g1~~TRINITY_DN1247_c0_g1_i1.p1  ORF type:complete len:694 (-),score=167.84 TRINITY_DN1247_c0_g1_i1:59-2140(-)
MMLGLGSRCIHTHPYPYLARVSPLGPHSNGSPRFVAFPSLRLYATKAAPGKGGKGAPAPKEESRRVKRNQNFAAVRKETQRIIDLRKKKYESFFKKQKNSKFQDAMKAREDVAAGVAARRKAMAQQEKELMEDRDIDDLNEWLDDDLDEFREDNADKNFPDLSVLSKSKAYELYKADPYYWSPIRLGHLFDCSVARMKLILWEGKMREEATAAGAMYRPQHLLPVYMWRDLSREKILKIERGDLVIGFNIFDEDPDVTIIDPAVEKRILYYEDMAAMLKMSFDPLVDELDDAAESATVPDVSPTEEEQKQAKELEERKNKYVEEAMNNDNDDDDDHYENNNDEGEEVSDLGVEGFKLLENCKEGDNPFKYTQLNFDEEKDKIASRLNDSDFFEKVFPIIQKMGGLEIGDTEEKLDTAAKLKEFVMKSIEGKTVDEEPGKPVLYCVPKKNFLTDFGVESNKIAEGLEAIFGSVDFKGDFEAIPPRERFINKKNHTWYYIPPGVKSKALLSFIRKRYLKTYQESPRISPLIIPDSAPIEKREVSKTFIRGETMKGKKTKWTLVDTSDCYDMYNRPIIIRDTDNLWRTANWEERREVHDRNRYIKFPWKYRNQDIILHPDEEHPDKLDVNFTAPASFTYQWWMNPNEVNGPVDPEDFEAKVQKFSTSVREDLRRKEMMMRNRGERTPADGHSLPNR